MLPLAGLMVDIGMLEKDVWRWRMNAVITLIPLLPPSWSIPQWDHRTAGEGRSIYHTTIIMMATNSTTITTQYAEDKTDMSLLKLVILNTILNVMITTNTNSDTWFSLPSAVCIYNNVIAMIIIYLSIYLMPWSLQKHPRKGLVRADNPLPLFIQAFPSCLLQSLASTSTSFTHVLLYLLMEKHYNVKDTAGF